MESHQSLRCTEPTQCHLYRCQYENNSKQYSILVRCATPVWKPYVFQLPPLDVTLWGWQQGVSTPDITSKGWVDNPEKGIPYQSHNTCGVPNPWSYLASWPAVVHGDCYVTGIVQGLRVTGVLCKYTVIIT